MQNQVSPDLRRNPDDKMVFGVASGLSDYFGLDVAIVRVIFAVTAILSFGITLLIYLLLAIFIPEREKSSSSSTDATSQIRTSSDKTLVERRRQLAGVIVIGLGIVLLAANFGWFAWFSFGRLWPLLLIALGAALLAGMFRSGNRNG